MEVFSLEDDKFQYVVSTDAEGYAYDLTIQSLQNPQDNYIYMILDKHIGAWAHNLAEKVLEDGIEIDPRDW